MENRFVFDYYYGVEAVQFSFVKIPRFLFKDERFNSLSTDAKMLYSLMLERMYLSAENGWYDEEDRVYIIYSQEDIMKDIGCANGKSSTLVAELKNFGLIEKKKRGQGKKDITYVKNFTTLEPVVETENYLVSFSDKNVIRESRKSDFKKNENRISRNAKIESQEMRKSNFKKCENQISRNAKIKSQEMRKSNAKNNYTEKNYINSINLSTEGMNLEVDQISDEIDEMEKVLFYRDLVKRNIGYDDIMSRPNWPDRELFAELFEVICDVVCVKRKTIKVNGANCPYELVKSKFLKLNNTHLQYVINCMQKTNKKIKNIRGYMITALYNAPDTIDHFYQQIY